MQSWHCCLHGLKSEGKLKFYEADKVQIKSTAHKEVSKTQKAASQT